MPHNPASIVRLLYGERVAEEEDRAEALSLNPASNSLTSAPPHRSRPPFENAWNGACFEARLRIS